MDFEERIKMFAGRIEDIKSAVSNEESTKTSLILPFFQILGYDIFNPCEFMPEFTADVGIKKKEKVDYAIAVNGAPIILIEAKAAAENLDKYGSQLFRYFATTEAKFGILTNGVEYKFFTDLDKSNKMDSAPFFEINLLNLKDQQITELKKFHKDFFDVDAILNTASDLRDIGAIKAVLRREIFEPSDDFVRLVLSAGVYDGLKTASVIERYQPLIKRCLSSLVGDLVNSRLKTALEGAAEEDAPPQEELIVTTQDEIDAYYIVKSILRSTIDPKRITYKDTQSYFAVLVDNKVTRWICRFYLKESVMYLTLPDARGKIIRHDISDLNDIFAFAEELEQRVCEVK